MNKHFKRTLVFAAFFFLALSLFASETGEIRGKVVDEKGEPLPGVTITAISPSLQGERGAFSDSQGNFKFPLLPVGKYSLTFELSGFEMVKQTGYDVRLGFTISIEVVLKMATISEQIVVTAETPLIDITNVDTSYRLNADDLTLVPTQERTIQEIIQYTPGVTGVRANTVFGTGTGLPSFRGEGEEGNNWLVDGLSSRGARKNEPGVRLNFDAWAEVQVISDPFEPDMGHSMGGIVNIVTKSGGNEFHGELGTLIRDRHLRADRKEQLSVVTVPSTSISQYYGNIGGPIIKDKLWFFLSDNYHRTADLTDAESIGWLTFPSGEKKLNTNNLFGKITFTPHANHTFSFSGTLDTFLSQSGGIGLPETYTKSVYTDYSYRINYKGIIDQNTFLEAAFGQTDRDSTLRPLEEDYDPARYYWTDIGQYTNNAEGDRRIIEGRTDFNARFTKFVDMGSYGNHEFGLGVSYYRNYAEDSMQWTGQDYDLWTGNGFDNGVEITWESQGMPIQLTEYGVREVSNTTRGFGLYIKDRITYGRFTLMLGLRAETQKVFNDAGEESVSFGLGDFLSPRVSLAVDLFNDGKSILKFGFGLFTNPLTTRLMEFFNTQGGMNYRKYSWEGGSNPTDAQLKDSANWQFAFEQSAATTPYDIDSDLKPNKTTKFLLGLEQRLGLNWALKLRGIYSYARDITELIGVYDPDTIYYFYLTNFELKKRDYRAIEFEVNGKISDKLILKGSYTWSQAKGTNPGQFEFGFWAGTLGNLYEAGVFGDHVVAPEGNSWKPILDSIFGGLGGRGVGDEGWYGFLPYSVDHQAKILGSYFAPYGFVITANFEFLSGYHWEKKEYLASYGDYYLFPEGRGGRTTPSHVYVDVSVEKDFALPQGFVLGLRLNVFNLLNSQRPISFVKADTELFGDVWGRQLPRWLQLQVALKF